MSVSIYINSDLFIITINSSDTLTKNKDDILCTVSKTDNDIVEIYETTPNEAQRNLIFSSKYTNFTSPTGSTGISVCTAINDLIKYGDLQYDAIYIDETRWRTISTANAFHIASAVTAADVFWHTTLGQSSIRQNVGSSNPPAFTYLKASDYVSSIGLTPKLRIKVSLMAVNDTAPARTLTVGLYPCNSPTSGTTGGVGVRAYASGTVVTGSNTISFASPAADNMTFDQYTQSFSFPSDGLYSIATSISGALTANSGVHILAELQVHFE